jgi:hypothetical protein
MDLTGNWSRSSIGTNQRKDNARVLIDRRGTDFAPVAMGRTRRRLETDSLEARHACKRYVGNGVDRRAKQRTKRMALEIAVAFDFVELRRPTERRRRRQHAGRRRLLKVPVTVRR